MLVILKTVTRFCPSCFTCTNSSKGSPVLPFCSRQGGHWDLGVWLSGGEVFLCGAPALITGVSMALLLRTATLFLSFPQLSSYCRKPCLGRSCLNGWPPTRRFSPMSFFFLQLLSPTERNYDIGNRELLAIKLAMEEWCHWLKGTATASTSPSPTLLVPPI